MAKNKIKTHSGAKKRFKVTGTGKIKYRRTNRVHGFTKKTKKNARSGRGNTYADKSNMAEIKALIPYK